MVYPRPYQLDGIKCTGKPLPVLVMHDADGRIIPVRNCLPLRLSHSHRVGVIQHGCIVQHELFGRESWHFTHDGTTTSIDVPARLWINSASGKSAASVAGLGISLAIRVMAGEELRDGRLTQLFKYYRLDTAGVYALYPAGPRPSAKVRSIVDNLGAALTPR